MQVRGKALDVGLVTLAALSPLLYLLGLATRGLALLYLDFPRLALVLGLLSVSAGMAVYLIFRRGPAWVRLAAAAALCANLGGLAYSWTHWSAEAQRARTDDLVEPFARHQVGVILAPLNDTPAAAAELMAVEDALVDILRRNGADDLLAVRRSHPLPDEEQALRLGARLNAHVVVWSEWAGGSAPAVLRHVRVLGAHQAPTQIDGAALMRLMATQQHLVVASPAAGEEGGVSSVATEVIAPAAAGFSALAAGHPVVAATQFRNAARAEGLSDETRALLLGYRATALLYAERPDLAMDELSAARSLGEGAYLWAALGNVHLAAHEWDAAREAYQRAIALDPYDPLGYCGLGLTLAHGREARAAIAAYERAVALAPDWAAPHALMGMAYELLGDADTAQEHYALCEAKAGPNPALQQAASDRASVVAQNPPTAVPTNTPRPTPTPTPVPSSGVYQVKQGDTLQAIAIRLDVPMDLLAEVNGLDNPNDLSIGQILVIPELP